MSGTQKEAMRAEDKRRGYGPCGLCWHVAWVPVPREDGGKPHVYGVPGVPEAFMRCDYCWLSDQCRSARREENEACVQAALGCHTSSDHELIDAIIAAIRAHMEDKT